MAPGAAHGTRSCPWHPEARADSLPDGASRTVPVNMMTPVVGRPAIALALMLGTVAGAGGRAGAGDLSQEDRIRAEALGALVQTRLEADLDGVPLREALKLLATAIDTPIVGRYGDDPAGHGLEPDLPVYVRMHDVSALLVLETILEQAAIDLPCTWQLRAGVIEAGTKSRLSAPGAVERRTYPIRDLMLEPPYFEGPSPHGAIMGPSTSIESFEKHPYRTAAITRPEEARPDGRGGFVARKRPEVLSAEIVEAIVELVEPGNWDYGQGDDLGDDITQQGVPPPGEAPPVPMGVGRPAPGKIARIRVWREYVVIDAPDFIHRQVNGYRRPIAPDPPGPGEILARSPRAADGRGGITFLGLRAVETAPPAPAAVPGGATP